MDWHPYAARYPLMEGEKYERTKADIAENGQIETVKYRIVAERKQYLDGRNRVMICADLGLPLREEEVFVADDNVEKYIRSVNLHRRHLSAEFEKSMILELRAEGLSTRKIAEEVGTSKSTVARTLAEEAKAQEAPKTEPPAEKPKRTRKPKPETKNGSIAAKVDEALAEPEKEPSVNEEMAEANRILESFARDLLAFFDSRVPASEPWVAWENRLAGARQKVADACAYLRSMKCSNICPKCEGARCKECLETGRVPKAKYDQMV